MAAITRTPMGSGLTFTGMTHLGISRGYDLQFQATDPAARIYLCIGREDNRVLVSGTTPLSRQSAVLNAIDQLGQWSQDIDLWMVAEQGGVTICRTAPVRFHAHVKPFYGQLRISDIDREMPRLTYPGNGHGRVLSARINDRYYFQLGGRLETRELNRGFDCTTFPLALLQVPRLPPPGYGKQLCEAAGAVKCELEQIHSDDLERRFTDDTIPAGIYIVFSAGHVLLYNSDINTLYEFTHGGFKQTLASQRKMKAPQSLWWIRKLDEKYRPCFR